MIKNIFFSKKTFMFLAVLFFATAGAFSQDVITLRNGDEISATVQEIGIDNVTYKHNGQVYTKKQSEIFRIVRSNGEIVVFNKTAVTTSETRSAVNSNKTAANATSNNKKQKDKYTVEEPIAVIAVDKMNVLYAGIENPITISALGVTADKISLNIEGCSVVRTGLDRYNIKPPESLIGRTVTAIASATEINKGTQSLGNQIFRIKRVPDPQAKLGALSAGKRAKQEILANPFIVAEMDEGFAYDLTWTITSFQVSIIERGMEGVSIPVQGNQLPASIITNIKNAAPRTIIQITEIRASSPELPTRNLNNLLISIR